MSGKDHTHEKPMRTQELTKSTLIVRDTFQTVRSKRAYLDDIEDNHKAPFIFEVVSLKSKCSLTNYAIIPVVVVLLTY